MKDDTPIDRVSKMLNMETQIIQYEQAVPVLKPAASVVDGMLVLSEELLAAANIQSTIGTLMRLEFKGGYSGQTYWCVVKADK